MKLIAGILLVFISIAHIIYGEQKQLPALRRLTKNPIILGSQQIMILQGGFLLLATGIIQILNALTIIELTGIAKYFLVGIVLINFCTALFFGMFIHKELLKISIPKFMLFVVIICLQVLAL